MKEGRSAEIQFFGLNGVSLFGFVDVYVTLARLLGGTLLDLHSCSSALADLSLLNNSHVSQILPNFYILLLQKRPRTR